MAVNIALIFSILQKNLLKKYFYGIQINLFSNEKANDFFNFFIYFLLPPLLFNYFIIFRNKHYEKLILKYKFHNGELFASYFIISLFLPIFLLLIAYII